MTSFVSKLSAICVKKNLIDEEYDGHDHHGCSCICG